MTPLSTISITVIESVSATKKAESRSERDAATKKPPEGERVAEEVGESDGEPIVRQSPQPRRVPITKPRTSPIPQPVSSASSRWRRFDSGEGVWTWICAVRTPGI
jgi:hypothetical protein